ncbi:MAG: hypothetical protein H7641_12605 [Candidatus Heimdallarchaeota archaeon]|nr:hypothetical protein [Candidatus Heimdallarchaeota archaeon]MCK4878400.1 hypothetical protein [Candidatus Heimdallarchaeota archaeon]
MSRKLHFCLFFMILFLAFLSPGPMQISAEQDYLIVRVLDAEYPPSVYIAESNPYTLFEFEIEFQIENPTQSIIECPVRCSPVPSPYLKTTLQNTSITVYHSVSFYFSYGNFSIHPGIYNKSEFLVFTVCPYQNNSLPLGEYEVWFDFPNCSSVPVPVVTEKLVIDVTETSVTYYFDYNNESRVVSSVQQTDYQTSVFIISSVFMIVLYDRRNRIKRTKL